MKISLLSTFGFAALGVTPCFAQRPGGMASRPGGTITVTDTTDDTYHADFGFGSRSDLDLFLEAEECVLQNSDDDFLAIDSSNKLVLTDEDDQVDTWHVQDQGDGKFVLRASPDTTPEIDQPLGKALLVSALLSQYIYGNDGTLEEMQEQYDLGTIELRDEFETTGLGGVTNRQQVLKHDGVCYGVFRGTDFGVAEDVSQNLNVFTKEVGSCTVHGGFDDNYSNRDAFRSSVTSCVRSCINRHARQGKRCPLVLTGHSQGGATAVVASLYLKGVSSRMYVSTFGAPRVVRSGCDDIDTDHHFRFVNAEPEGGGLIYDAIPSVSGGGSHYGHAFVLTSNRPAYLGLNFNDNLDPQAHVHSTSYYIEDMALWLESTTFPTSEFGWDNGQYCNYHDECQSEHCSTTDWVGPRKCAEPDADEAGDDGGFLCATGADAVGRKSELENGCYWQLKEISSDNLSGRYIQSVEYSKFLTSELGLSTSTDGDSQWIVDCPNEACDHFVPNAITDLIPNNGLLNADFSIKDMIDTVYGLVSGSTEFGVMIPDWNCRDPETTLSDMGDAAGVDACGSLNFFDETEVLAFGAQVQGNGYCVALNFETLTFGVAQTGFLEVTLFNLVTVTLDAIGVSINRELSLTSHNKMWDGNGAHDTAAERTFFGNFVITGTATLGIDLKGNNQIVIEATAAFLVDVDPGASSSFLTEGESDTSGGDGTGLAMFFQAEATPLLELEGIVSVPPPNDLTTFRTGRVKKKSTKSTLENSSGTCQLQAVHSH